MTEKEKREGERHETETEIEKERERESDKTNEGRQATVVNWQPCGRCTQ